MRQEHWLDNQFVLIRHEDDEPSVDWIIGLAGRRHAARDQGPAHRPVQRAGPQAAAGAGGRSLSQMLHQESRTRRASGSSRTRAAALAREAPGCDISGSAHFINKCDNGLVVHRNRDEAREPRGGHGHGRQGEKQSRGTSATPSSSTTSPTGGTRTSSDEGDRGGEEGAGRSSCSREPVARTKRPSPGSSLFYLFHAVPSSIKSKTRDGGFSRSASPSHRNARLESNNGCQHVGVVNKALPPLARPPVPTPRAGLAGRATPLARPRSSGRPCRRVTTTRTRTPSRALGRAGNSRRVTT